MLAGGTHGSYSLEILSTESSLSRKRLAELPFAIYDTPLLFHYGKTILICGGGDNENKCLMHERGTWKDHSYLNKYRTFASAVTTVEGKFIFGGRNSDRTFEYLPQQSKRWKIGQTNIPDGFTGGCGVALPAQRKILLIGGEGTEKRILQFDMSSGAFEEMRLSLIKGRSYHACARIPDTSQIVITGGFDSDGNEHGTTEILNFEDNTIMLGNSMNTKRDSHGMALISTDDEDRLAVFGGINENLVPLDSVETFNSKTKKWEVSDLKLGGDKTSFGYTSILNDFISKL